jgi:hypothetical protein
MRRAYDLDEIQRLDAHDLTPIKAAYAGTHQIS